ncbi:FAD/NAD(P)-binding protein [Aquimarina intermedia]|uniref:FAD-NAD(P)-binding protein n=1 Tax=Aquimarina intermedia TaxID=350814 RepID=A0A5S5BSD2_9FLAO|nr:FAD/NAD(P)-binding protein [Aquimarina intermedia]TYP69969.1 FAD-NAD(P)-binding protein [Aquimarina intermedia]
MPGKELFNDEPLVIGIVGFGPKGLYGLERLLAAYKNNGSERRIILHLFNNNDHFGSGSVYRTDQPSYLLMNYANRYIDMWPRTEPRPIVEDTLTFSEWYSSTFEDPKKNIDAINAPRKLVGQYLKQGLSALLEHKPKNIIIIQHVFEIHSIDKREDGYYISGVNNHQQEIAIPQAFDELLITTGHQRNKNNDNTLYPEAKKGMFIDFVYPVQNTLAHIENNATVAIKGLGLTFIDTILALTEGRGGRFVKVTDAYQYCKSGEEPAIVYPFSISGLPMIPRAAIANDDFETPEPLYFQQAYKRAYKQLQQKTRVNFRTELLPAIQKDVQFAYYQKLFELKGESLFFNEDYSRIEQTIRQLHKQFPEEEKFSLQSLLDPIPQESYDHDRVIAYIKDNLTAIKNYGAQAPIQLAVSMWRKISPLFNNLYSFGGLTAESQEDFDANFSGHFNRIAYGAPVINMKKLVALADSGIVNFSYAKSPIVKVFKEKDNIQLKHSTDKTYSYCDHLIDARIPKTNIEAEKTQLFAKLCERKLATPFINASNNYQYAPGCLAITNEGHLIRSDGEVEKGITLYGTPTEGITFDNDTLSRTRNDFASQWANKIIEATTLISV